METDRYLERQGRKEMKTEWIVGIAIALMVFLCYVIVKRNEISKWLELESTKEKIRQLCREAELIIVGTKKGQERLDWVVEQLYKRLPDGFETIVTKPFLKAMLVKMINVIFDQIAVVMRDGSRRAV